MQHETNVTVRFGETDLLGHVNNSSYFTYFEHARIQFFKALDASGGNLRRFILASTTCDFLAQAYFDQTLSIKTKVGKIGNKSCLLLHSIHDQKTDKPIAKGESTVVNFDFNEQKSKRIPDELREKLKPYMV